MSAGNAALTGTGLAEKIFAQFKAGLGRGWEERLTPADRELIKAASLDAANVLLLGMAGSDERAAREKAHAEAQLLNVAAIESAEAVQRLWSAAAAALKATMAVVLA